MPNVPGGNVWVDGVTQCRCGVALALKERDNTEAREIVDAQHRLPVAGEERLIEGASLVDEESPRLSVGSAVRYLQCYVSPHPGFGAFRTRDPRSRRSHSRCPSRPVRHILDGWSHEMMKFNDVARVGLAASSDFEWKYFSRSL